MTISPLSEMAEISEQPIKPIPPGMAKSLRSKIKRANRTQLRKVYAEPLIKKRQNSTTKKLHGDIEVKSGGSLASLAAAMKKQEGQMDSDDEDDDDDEEEEGVDGKNKMTNEGKSLPFSEPKGGSLMPVKGFGRQGLKKVAGAQASMVAKLKEKKGRLVSKKEASESDKEVSKKKSKKDLVWFD